MSKIKMIGLVFSKLTVIAEAGRAGDGSVTWLCECECGKTTVVSGVDIRRGTTKSCGCGQGNVKHRQLDSKAYRSWQAMKNRCQNPNASDYKNYGGRGIKICAQWQNFEQFHLDMGDPPDSKYTLDRINNDDDYYPENCQWATKQTQMNNTRRSRKIIWQGQEKTVADWARELKINYSALHVSITRHGIDHTFKHFIDGVTR